MQKHIKSIVSLAVLQIICLAFGLWIQDRILVQTAAWQHRHGKDPAHGTAVNNAKAATAESIVEAMPTARFLTFIWIGGLQLIAMFLVITRLLADGSRSRAQSQIQLMQHEKDLVRTRNAVMIGLASLAESRDHETGQHLERIALYSTRLAAALRGDPRFRNRISPSFVKSIGISSVLHDIGKVGVPDAILLKPGSLTPNEWQQMRRHSVIGSECIKHIERRLGNSNFLQVAHQIALHHHERWDGNGYPHELAGEAIPLAARIVAVADVYDALSMKRVYKDAFPHERCVAIIREEAGRQLDPAIVDVFLKIQDEFQEIAKRFTASDDTPFDRKPKAPTADSVEQAPEDQLLESMLEFEESLETSLVGAA